MPFSIKTTAFTNGQGIPKHFTGEGEDVSPPLEWNGIPKDTKELALICDDPDAPGKTWVHWVMYKIPSQTTKLPEGILLQERLDTPATALQGKNSWDKIGYGGPMPPPGHETHHYHFKLYALDTTLNLSQGVTKEELLSGMEGHILETTEVMGTYER